ncbi:hypothetical protein AGMMS49579_07850 [Spirochaetia bacterium]|nr:hypothetical protein AGMMS49579_07850 [Spirochaetia bacterium]
MKKVFVILMFAAVIGTAAFAQQGLFSAGLVVVPNFGGQTDPDLNKSTYFGFGYGAYFDAKYAVVNLGLNSVTPYYDGTMDPTGTNYLTFGLLGKYPIAIGEKFTIAPAVGLDYQLFLNSGISRADLENTGYEASDVAEQFDNFVIKFGALADFTIIGGLYVRAGVLADLGLPHKDREPADLTFGVSIPIGIGYRF